MTASTILKLPGVQGPSDMPCQWSSGLPVLVATLCLVACAQPDVVRNLDLQRDVILDHDDPRFGARHPAIAEIEDSLNSTELAFPRRTIAGGTEDDSFVIRINFIDRPTGNTQYLLVDAENTGPNNPETFANRPLADRATHEFHPGVQLRNSGGTVLPRGTTTGRLLVILHGVSGELDRNFYGVDLVCDQNACRTRAHFPARADCVFASLCPARGSASQDLTDNQFAFSGATFQVTMDRDCHAGCKTVTLNRIQFWMLGGDLVVINTANP